MRIFGHPRYTRFVAVAWTRGEKMQLGNAPLEGGEGAEDESRILQRVLIHALSRGHWKALQVSVLEAAHISVAHHQDVTQAACERYLADHIDDHEVRDVIHGKPARVVTVTAAVVQESDGVARKVIQALPVGGVPFAQLRKR